MLYKVLALVFVGIIDTGIDFTHPDLADNYSSSNSEWIFPECPDDIFYDAAKKQIYVSCGEGFINIFQQQQQEDANHYNAIASIPTAPGARTSLFASELNRFYLAVPHLGNQESEILVYQVGW